MKRRYTYPATDLGQQRFRCTYLAFSARGKPEPQARQSKEIHRSERRILGQLKAVSVPHPKAEPLAPGDLDSRMRVLAAGGGTIELDQADFKRLQDYVESYQWEPVFTDAAIDLEDSLEVDSEKVPAPTAEPDA